MSADAKKATRAQERVPVPRLEIVAALVVKGFGTADVAMRYGAMVFMSWMAKESIEALAGKTTVAVFSAVADWAGATEGGIERTVLLVSLSINAIGIGAFWAMRRYYRHEIGRMADDKKKLETLIDPGRTTSGLLRSGANPKGDGR